MRHLKIEIVGNVLTKPFEATGPHLLQGLQPAWQHYDIDHVTVALNSKQPRDLLILHLDHRWFFDVAPDDAALDRLAELSSAIEQSLANNSCNVVLNTIAFSPWASTDSREHELSERLWSLNSQIFALAKRDSRVTVVDTAKVIERIGFANAIRERNRYLVQHPYSSGAVDELCRAYARAISAVFGARKKVVALDADNTLWRGIIGEDGWDGVQCDLEYPGVFHYLFQKQLLQMKDDGVLLAVVTKNNEADFQEVFEKRSFPLKLEDFVTVRSNWDPKSQNIESIAEELNVGVDSMVLIDDNQFELDEVASRLPSVGCYKFPVDSPERALDLLASIPGLRARSITAEDQAKLAQYRDESKRKELKKSAGSAEDFLQNLDIEIQIGRNRTSQIKRIAQLTNKTNQFNLTTTRYSEADIAALFEMADVYDVRVVDKIGDMGVIGVVIVKDGHIDTFLLSCRVLGRKVETSILSYVCERSRRALTARFARTAKNGMAESFLPENGFELVSRDGQIFNYRQTSIPERNKYVRIKDV